MEDLKVTINNETKIIPDWFVDKKMEHQGDCINSDEATVLEVREKAIKVTVSGENYIVDRDRTFTFWVPISILADPETYISTADKIAAAAVTGMEKYEKFVEAVKALGVKVRARSKVNTICEKLTAEQFDAVKNMVKKTEWGWKLA